MTPAGTKQVHYDGRLVIMPAPLANWAAKQRGHALSVAMFFLNASLQAPVAEGHHHWVFVSLDELQHGIWSRDGRRCRVTGIDASRTTLWRLVKSAIKEKVLLSRPCVNAGDQVIHIPRAGSGVDPRRSPGGIATGGQLPNAYAIVQAKCMLCKAPVTEDSQPDPRTAEYNDRRRQNVIAEHAPAVARNEPDGSRRPSPRGWQPPDPAWVESLDERSRGLGELLESYLSKRYLGLPANPVYFPRPAQLQASLAAIGSAPLDEVAVALKQLRSRGQLPFEYVNGRACGPYTDKFWPGFLFDAVGQRHGGTASPSRTPKAASAAAGASVRPPASQPPARPERPVVSRPRPHCAPPVSPAPPRGTQAHEYSDGRSRGDPRSAGDVLRESGLLESLGLRPPPLGKKNGP